jgi:hypothetical protein
VPARTVEPTLMETLEVREAPGRGVIWLGEKVMLIPGNIMFVDKWTVEKKPPTGLIVRVFVPTVPC